MFLRSSVLLAFAASASAFLPAPAPSLRATFPSHASLSSRSISLRGGAAQSKMIDITPNVSFDTIAREWRCKWSADADKKSLVEAQNALNEILAEVKKVDGVKSVQRVVCGGCLDFKIITALEADKYGKWEEAKFAPEEKFLAKIKGIQGISQVETQTFTLMPM
ncbi:hypothetical protein GUITHDRAFT_195477 [Guillardia theta CCMP2712]|uniref:Uncharacterized protein n=2 Tax=Guillardia theta TaxID=55529 RepID=L1JXQ4_GUITC|nr:hypothetical protein GUITHDRAFT_195477 [Guillardia theta CCMP2712]EKX53147.1 hypothetical protein GUITHDRAFT_195477 [Guillardia theta CCMP2712]|eukprot:XP_005840127.1 hypothetical protein GUITHDRAFT_195477 [Guillardia theta CCMP2712]